jgi:predicted nucleotidyltransferase
MMALSSKQIREWSQRGDPIQAWYSYEMVQGSLTQGKLEVTWSVYPQGSYANKTNIAADSDVDLVVALTSSFYPNKEDLSLIEREEYDKYYEQAERTWRDFRDAVTRILRQNFWVVEGSKAVKVRSGPIRLPADVLIALEHRHYKSFLSFEGQIFVDGVQFYRSGDHKIVNFPKQHREACAAKERRTAENYRNVVRVAKNARNALIADDRSQVGPGTAPSYFLESLLWNVPDLYFSDGPCKAYPQAIRWLDANQRELWKMEFPNGRGRLFGNTSDASWSQSSAKQIIGGLYGQL